MKKIDKAKKELKEAEEAVYLAAKEASGDAKNSLTHAVSDIEKAEAEVEESE